MDSEFYNKWQSQVKKGIFEYIILLFLSDKSYYGYELISDIKQLTSYEIAEGTIYPLLNRLKKEELVASEWMEMEVGVPRKYYKITEKGQAELGNMKEHWLNLSFAIQKLILKS